MGPETALSRPDHKVDRLLYVAPCCRAAGAIGATLQMACRPSKLVTDVIESFLSDAAHVPGGHAAGVAFPRNAGEVAALVASARRVLPIGAQSSLTGGATPRGELIRQHARTDRHHAARWRHGSRRRGRSPRRAAAKAHRPQPLLPARSDLRRRLRGRHDCHQRRGRGDVQVRQHPRGGLTP